MADYAFKGYDNFVLAEKIESILSTKMDMNRFMTIDYSLTQEPGMVKKVHTYVGSGVAEDLARGEGLSNYVDADYTEREYRVARTQSGAKWYDDDVMTDPTLIDTKVQTVAESMVNDWSAKAVAEFDKTNNKAVFANYDLGDFADAIAVYANKYESQEGLFFLADVALIPTLRKTLGDYLKYTEAYIRTGAVGEILGVPVYTSKAVPKNMMFLATNDAVHAFLKKDTFIEQDRNIDTKENKMIASKYSVIALVDETKCIKCGKAQATAATIATKTAGAKAIAGAAATGAKVTAYILDEEEGWVKTGNVATAVANAYSITADENLVTGDKIKVEAVLEGFLPEVVEATV